MYNKVSHIYIYIYNKYIQQTVPYIYTYIHIYRKGVMKFLFSMLQRHVRRKMREISDIRHASETLENIVFD